MTQTIRNYITPEEAIVYSSDELGNIPHCVVKRGKAILATCEHTSVEAVRSMMEAKLFSFYCPN